MKLLFLLGFVAIAFAATNNIHAQTRADLHFAARQLQALLPTGEAPVIPRPVHLQEVNATACIEAWMQLSDLLNTSCGDVAVLYGNVTGVNVSQIVEGQCVTRDANNHTCEQKVSAAIGKFSSYCSGPGLLNITEVGRASLSLWLTMAKIPCIQDDTGAYCYPIFQDALMGFTTQMDNGVAITPGLLDQICIPCVNKVVNELAIWGIKEFVALSVQLKIACTQRNGQYCLPAFIAATKVDGDINTPSELDAVCNECVRIIAYRYLIATNLLGSEDRGELGTFLLFQGVLCQQNNKEQYCYNLLQSYDSSQIQAPCATLALDPTSCPGSNCQKQISKFSSAMGCCFGTWFNWLEFVYVYNITKYNEAFSGGAFVPTPDQIRLMVHDLCKVNIPMSCAKKKLVVTWTVLNILADWYNKKKAEFENNFKQLVAYILSTDPDVVVDITTSYDPVKNGIVVSVEVSGFNDVLVKKYADYLGDHTQISDDANAVVAGIKDDSAEGASQQASINDPIIITAQSTTLACADSTCWACSLSTPSFSLLALLFLLLAYFN